MTAAFSQRDEAAKQAARLKCIAEAIAEPAVAGANGRKPLKPKTRLKWREVVDVVVKDAERSAVESNALAVANQWQEQCRAAGLTFGWLIWRVFFPMLLELANRWLELNKNQQESDSGR